MSLERFREIRREIREEEVINLNPIQRGGVLTPAARRALVEFGDGYSICDRCPPKTPRLDMIEKPPVKMFYEELAKFLGLDVARVVTRCREAMFIAIYMLGDRGGYVVLDSLAHYSTYLAVELAKMKVKEVPNTGYPEFRVEVEKYREKIEEVVDETGELPVAVVLTHVDSYYGNLADAKAVGEICKKYGVPFILNAAYTAGVMPVNGRELRVDILVSSGHKSWAASAPTGILAMTDEMAQRVLKTSEIKGDLTGRSFPVKELGLLGCTVMGAPLATLIASFPDVVERVKRWGEELEKARYLASEMEKIEGTKLLGVKPKMHTLMHFESMGFYKVSQSHKRRGFFLYDELKKRKIVGIQPGLTKHFKLNTYGLSWDQVRYVASVFKEIAKKYGLETV